jgi:tripartite ATP-independent transporter DctM subunit
MYEGALLPGLLLTSFYIGYVFITTLLYPDSAPALPKAARNLHGWTLWHRVFVSLIPPLVLIFLVLGTIFLGIATPTEGGAMGASGALLLALLKRKLSWDLLRQAMDSTAKLSSFVLFILIGSTVFGLVFRGVNGDLWVEHLLTSLPGGQIGFLIAVNILVFLLAFFLDFFELAFIIVPLLAPVAEKLGIDLVWFGVLLGVNMQTSFMHPPFGFALFYLRSVAPKIPYLDKITGQNMAPITTGQIYWGAIPFVCLQLVMVAILITFPGLVLDHLHHAPTVDPASISIDVPSVDYSRPEPGLEPNGSPNGSSESDDTADTLEADILRSLTPPSPEAAP